MPNPKRIIIFEIVEVQQGDTGRLDYYVNKATACALPVDLVGVNTAMLGQSQGFNLTHSIVIDRGLYRDQKYLYFDNQLYEVKSLSRAKSIMQLQLNCQLCGQDKVLAAVERWLNANI